MCHQCLLSLWCVFVLGLYSIRPRWKFVNTKRKERKQTKLTAFFLKSKQSKPKTWISIFEECIISRACAVVISKPEWWNKWRHNFIIYHISCIIKNKSSRGRLFAHQERNLSVGHTSIHSRVSQSVIWAELRLKLFMYISSDCKYSYSHCFKILKISEF